MNEVYRKLTSCAARVREITDFVPHIALILGSGLGDYGNTVETVCEVDYRDIEGFPVSTVPGHAGKFIFGYAADETRRVPVVLMSGRVHYYEGYDISDVVLPVRLMKLLGARTLFLTNASGGIAQHLNVGDLMLITDHIASFVPNPLRGENIEELGTRFPDMTKTYSPALQELIRKTAADCGISLKEGVYLQTPGPSFETPAEIRLYRTIGADTVGMSTAVEAIAARHMGMDICGISCISNKAAGFNEKPLTHEEVKEAADAAAPRFRRLVTECILRMGEKI